MDQLDLWTDTATRSAIVDFVERVDRDGIPVAERVAVFDNDGTLWTEKPVQIQMQFVFALWAKMADADPSLASQQPFKAVVDRDFGWLSDAVDKHYAGDDTDMKTLMAGTVRASAGQEVEAYTASAKAFLDSGTHPSLGIPFARCVFAPMVELLRYLEAHDFTTYIASGGDRDFMRGAGEDLYAIPRERVIGSSLGLRYADGNVSYAPEMGFFDDGPEKPVRIWSRIGRKPLLVGGNSNGDVPMLEFCRDDGLQLLVHHDDGDREFAYDAGAEEALKAAADKGWTTVSMRDDWAAVFPDSET
ncbi:haloacid dehalogenase-like hydrolase [Rhodococcus spelaei]|uniref:Haloacid dehalogenase-like hydrolase n=1 Tax=Rhodococcus spelaei TaxID=2546320 RepID=A0A541BRF5_9NOCA|nr:haloacid dehalogenase-like hydrolase [Rhodococcus spelaei]TQF74921.1 haloacid dehalogenase-like hydrolase [Rhodococcus spelaei]